MEHLLSTGIPPRFHTFWVNTEVPKELAHHCETHSRLVQDLFHRVETLTAYQGTEVPVSTVTPAFELSGRIVGGVSLWFRGRPVSTLLSPCQISQ